jgi:hypothetical protein
MIPSRDPRIEPQLGDQLQRGAQWRQVICCDRGVRYMTSCCASRWISISKWQTWAKSAKILRIGPMDRSDRRPE